MFELSIDEATLSLILYRVTECFTFQSHATRNASIDDVFRSQVVSGTLLFTVLPVVVGLPVAVGLPYVYSFLCIIFVGIWNSQC
jgi:hypothetical protein